MNKFIKYGFMYVLGAATGGFVAVKLLEEHYANIADEEIEAVKEDAKKRIKNAEKQNEKLEVEVESKPEVEKTSIKNNIETNAYKKLCRDYTKPNLQELSIKYDKEINNHMHPNEDEDYHTEDDEDDALEESTHKHITTRDDTGPYLITGEEFANENFDFDKLSLWYYKLDKTLADDHDELVDDVTQLIGPDALGLFNNIGGEKTIYIRNEKMATDFEIICLAKSYREEILGVIKEE